MSLSKLALACLDTNVFFAQEIMDAPPVKRPRRKYYREYQEMYDKLRLNPEKFVHYTGVSLKTFDYILEKTEDEIIKAQEFCIDATLKVFITLRYISSGDSLKCLAKKFKIGMSTVSKCVYQTLKAISLTMKEHIQQPTSEKFMKLTRSFYQKYEFPNCIGAIGTKLFRINKRSNYGAAYLKAKKRSRYVLMQAIFCDNYKFLAIEINNRGETFHETKFCISLERNRFNVPRAQQLPKSGIILPNVLVGGTDMPLKSFLLRPYPQLKLDTPKKVYNQKIKEVVRTASVGFDVFTTKFKIFQKTLDLSMENCQLILNTGCLLHNIVRDIDGDGDYHYNVVLKRGALNHNIKSSKFAIKGRVNNRSTKNAMIIRDRFKEYFNELDI